MLGTLKKYFWLIPKQQSFIYWKDVPGLNFWFNLISVHPDDSLTYFLLFHLRKLWGKNCFPFWVCYKNEPSGFQGMGRIQTLGWGHDFAEGDFVNHLGADVNSLQWCSTQVWVGLASSPAHSSVKGRSWKWEEPLRSSFTSGPNDGYVVTTGQSKSTNISRCRAIC